MSRKTTVLLGGSAALILTDALHRGTNDGDVIASHPGLGQLQAAIRAVANARGLPAGWLNGSVQSYLDVLPPDYEARVMTLRPFGRLSVSLLSRRDVIVMKFYSGRGKDLVDLEQIAPTAAELAFAARELLRLAKIDAAKAKRMKEVLDAWPAAQTGATEMARVAAAHSPKSPTDDPLATIARQWARIGVWLSVEPASQAVDVEALIVRSARLTRDDPRLFVGAASWLAVHHGWVNARRLVTLMTDVARVDRVGSAVAGALLTLARQGAHGLAAGRASELDAAIEVCRPLARPRPLFTVMERFPDLRPQLRAAASPLYRRWGLWHDDESSKLTAIRPAGWLLRHVPELRVRALVGPSLESDLITLALDGPLTARDLARTTGVSYAAAHGAANRLVARGLLRRQRAGARQLLHLTGIGTMTIPRLHRRPHHGAVARD